ncbi:MAG: hypothetical protein QNK05_19195 [Myxococcota bacterium]|nr:hypothetical protein [Myxococcota bacterium]
MVHESMKNLRLDRRLTRRRGWVDPADLASELDALPDVADKAEVVTDDEAEAAAPAADAVPAPPAPIEPPGSDFG